ncbi:hypothetical protein ACP70R_015588 [Stipagrostis hirtigluma subsp. patula]
MPGNLSSATHSPRRPATTTTSLDLVHTAPLQTLCTRRRCSSQSSSTCSQDVSDGHHLLCGFHLLRLGAKNHLLRLGAKKPGTRARGAGARKPGIALISHLKHLMAGLVKWKLISREQLDYTKISGPKYHSYLCIGHIGNHDSFICHSRKSISRPKVRQYLIVKVHNKDPNETCSSKFAYEDNEIIANPYQRTEGNQLKALESYFAKLNSEKAQHLCSLPQKKKHKNSPSSPYDSEASIAYDNANFKKRLGTKSYRNTSIEDYYLIMEDDETSSFWLTNLLAAINIAVLLFEIASPVKNSENEYLSLPLIYGAKINNLILSGEWWRLLTPMCLHSGFLHIALGCWVLLTFGPRVCRAYGQMTFFLIYILGGVCGNFTSFVHTPELTVCGTGPVFSLIGAWLVYQSQNKEVIERDVSESMFRQAVMAAALSLLLSTFGRIDNWAHLGATVSGLFFGYLTCPGIKVDNAAKSGQKEAVALVRLQADPCRSIAIFAISIVALVALFFAYGTQFNILEQE